MYYNNHLKTSIEKNVNIVQALLCTYKIFRKKISSLEYQIVKYNKQHPINEKINLK